MPFDWQTLTVALVVLLAATYIGWRTYRTWLAKKAGGCGGGCAKCPTKSEPADFILLDNFNKHPK